MKMKLAVLLLWLLIFFTGCSEGAYKPYVEAIENSKMETAVHELWVMGLTEQEVDESPLKENYLDIRIYWASLLDSNSVSEKGKTVIKTPHGRLKVTRYKVHPSSGQVESLEKYLKRHDIMSVQVQIISYEEEGLVDLDGRLVESRVHIVVEEKARPGKKEKWRIISRYDYE